MTDAELRAAIQRWPTSVLLQAVAVRAISICNPYSGAWRDLEWPYAGRITKLNFHAFMDAVTEEVDRRFPTPQEPGGSTELMVTEPVVAASTPTGKAICPRCGASDYIDASQSYDCNRCGKSW